jgi:hypothetical protein
MPLESPRRRPADPPEDDPDVAAPPAPRALHEGPLRAELRQHGAVARRVPRQHAEPQPGGEQTRGAVVAAPRALRGECRADSRREARGRERLGKPIFNVAST